MINHRAFTLLETMIVIAIMAIIGLVVLPNFLNGRNNNDLSGTTSQVVSLVREAQSNAMNQVQGSAWGVRFINQGPTSFLHFNVATSGAYVAAYGVAIDKSGGTSDGDVYVTDNPDDIVKKYDSHNNFLLQFGSSGTGNGQFSNPQGIAVDGSGNVYVVDRGNTRVEEFNSSGTYVSQFGSYGFGNGQFWAPEGIAIDASGNIYVVDDSQRVEEFNSSGSYISQFGSYGTGNGQFGGATSIAIDASGNIYVTDNGNSRVEKFNSGGSYLYQLGPFSGATSPWALAIDSSGNVYVYDGNASVIRKFDSNGNYLFSIQPAYGVTGGLLQSWTGVNMAFDKKGNLYFGDLYGVDIFYGANNTAPGFALFSSPSTSPSTVASQVPQAIYRLPSTVAYSASSVFPGSRIDLLFSQISGVPSSTIAVGIYALSKPNNISSIVVASSGAPSINIPVTITYSSQFGSSGSGNGQFSNPQKIAVDASGSIYVDDYGNNRIEKFNSSGVYVSQFGSYGTGNGQFNGPEGIAFDASGNIYVVDYGNYRVEKFNSSGSYLSQFGSYGSGNGQFWGLEAIAIDGSGNIYVADGGDNRVEEFNSSGSYVSQFNDTANGQAGSPWQIVLDQSGNIYVTDTYLAYNGSYYITVGRILKFTSGGSLISQLTDSTYNWYGGLAVDSSGNVYAGNTNGSAIFVYDTNLNYLSQFGSSGSGNGQFTGPPAAIAVDGNGRIIALDSASRVEIFVPSSN